MPVFRVDVLTDDPDAVFGWIEAEVPADQVVRTVAFETVRGHYVKCVFRRRADAEALCRWAYPDRADCTVGPFPEGPTPGPGPVASIRELGREAPDPPAVPTGWWPLRATGTFRVWMPDPLPAAEIADRVARRLSERGLRRLPVALGGTSATVTAPTRRGPARVTFRQGLHSRGTLTLTPDGDHCDAAFVVRPTAVWWLGVALFLFVTGVATGWGPSMVLPAVSGLALVVGVFMGIGRIGWRHVLKKALTEAVAEG